MQPTDQPPLATCFVTAAACKCPASLGPLRAQPDKPGPFTVRIALEKVAWSLRDLSWGKWDFRSQAASR